MNTYKILKRSAHTKGDVGSAMTLNDKYLEASLLRAGFIEPHKPEETKVVAPEEKKTRRRTKKAD